MLRWLCVIAGLMLAVVIATSEWLRRRRVRRRERNAMAAWLSDNREESLRRIVAIDPKSSAAWYFLGCLRCRAGDFATAARLFGMAHHVDAELPSAALLTFSCLKAEANRGHAMDSWLQELAITWQEMRRPELGISTIENDLFETLRPGQPEPGLSTLGRMAMTMSGPDTNNRLKDA